MQYLGSKNRISKELKPIIERYFNVNTTKYIEPFVGGANMIDKIDFDRKIGSDVNPYLIALLQYVQDVNNRLPETITENEYTEVKVNMSQYEDWYVGLVGFCGSYGAKFFGGFANGNDRRDRPSEAIRNLAKQAPHLQGITFNCGDYSVYSNVKEAVIYCDPPYRGTTKYKTDGLNYEAFYEWCVMLAEHNTVLISEYNMPTDRFECVWEREYSVNLDAKREAKSTRIERLYKAIPKSRQEAA